MRGARLDDHAGDRLLVQHLTDTRDVLGYRDAHRVVVVVRSDDRELLLRCIERDIVWLTDFGGNAIVRFDPTTELFDPIELPSAGAAVRQLLGRPGEVWGAESARDKLVVVTEE
jgi:hypothetical protein